LETLNMLEHDLSACWNIHSIKTGRPSTVPVVLIHALGLDLTYWDHQIETLRKNHEEIAFDLPGHGESGGSPEDWKLEALCSMLKDTISKTGASSAHLVGLSVGSMIAQAFALAEPTMVQSLTLMGSAATFTTETRDFLRGLGKLTLDGGMEAIVASSMPYWFAAATKEQRPDILDRTARTLRQNNTALQAAAWEMIADYSVDSELHRINCPTLILVGDQDGNTPPQASELLAKLILRSELHVIPGAGHMLPFEAPNVVNEHLLAFLQRAATDRKQI
jgi:3-oxoadipate enol-lactonase